MQETSTLNPPLPREHWLSRLRYRSHHRGCKETDLVLGHYCNQRLDTMSDAELALWERFLDEDDADIWNWLTEKTPCPQAEYDALLSQMRSLPILPQ